jgi:hypothetical protein
LENNGKRERMIKIVGIWYLKEEKSKIMENERFENEKDSKRKRKKKNEFA